MNGKWMGIAAVVLAGLLGWGAWVTLGVAGSVPEDRYETQQQRLEDKLDKIKDLILKLHRR